MIDLADQIEAVLREGEEANLNIARRFNGITADMLDGDWQSRPIRGHMAFGQAQSGGKARCARCGQFFTPSVQGPLHLAPGLTVNLT